MREAFIRNTSPSFFTPCGKCEMPAKKTKSTTPFAYNQAKKSKSTRNKSKITVKKSKSTACLPANPAKKSKSTRDKSKITVKKSKSTARLPTISQKSLSPHETSLFCLKCLLSIQKRLSPQTSSLKDLHLEHLPPSFFLSAGGLGPYNPPWSQKMLPPSFFPSAGGLGPYNPPGGLYGPIEPKWGHIALHGGLYGPILAPGRAAWPHFGDGAMLPSFTTTNYSFKCTIYILTTC